MILLHPGKVLGCRDDDRAIHDNGFWMGKQAKHTPFVTINETHIDNPLLGIHLPVNVNVNALYVDLIN